jgi:hypothetical protein
VAREEIEEILLQAMIYCGVPGANSAFRQAREVFAQMERENLLSDPDACPRPAHFINLRFSATTACDWPRQHLQQ